MSVFPSIKLLLSAFWCLYLSLLLLLMCHFESWVLNVVASRRLRCCCWFCFFFVRLWAMKWHLWIYHKNSITRLGWRGAQMSPLADPRASKNYYQTIHKHLQQLQHFNDQQRITFCPPPASATSKSATSSSSRFWTWVLGSLSLILSIKNKCLINTSVQFSLRN